MIAMIQQTTVCQDAAEWYMNIFGNTFVPGVWGMGKWTGVKFRILILLGFFFSLS